MRYRRTNLPVISRTWQPSCKTSLDACELHLLHPVCEHREAVVSLSYGTRPELSLLMLQEGLGNGVVAATVSSGHGQPLSLSSAWLGGPARRMNLLHHIQAGGSAVLDTSSHGCKTPLALCFTSAGMRNLRAERTGPEMMNPWQWHYRFAMIANQIQKEKFSSFTTEQGRNYRFWYYGKAWEAVSEATVSPGHGQPLSLLSLAWLGGLAPRIILLVAMICYVTLRGQKVSGDMSPSIWKARFWSIFSRIARYVELSLGELYDVGTASIDLMLSARWTGHSVTDRWFSARVSFWKFVSCEAHWQAVRYPPEPEQEAMLKTAENCGPLTGQSNVGLSKNGDTPFVLLNQGKWWSAMGFENALFLCKPICWSATLFGDVLVLEMKMYMVMKTAVRRVSVVKNGVYPQVVAHF